MDCDLRHLLDAERQLEMRQIKVSTAALAAAGAALRSSQLGCQQPFIC
jgi:hypothetical protein